MKQILILSVICLITLPTNTNAKNQYLDLISNEDKCGWLIFGYGVMDSVTHCDDREINMDVNWEHATWGVGGMFTFEQPLNGKSIRFVQAEIKSANGFETKVYAGLSTKDDANIIGDQRKALTVSNKWEMYNFPITQMYGERPDITSRDFNENDWGNIQIVKILFTKPEHTANGNDKILIRNPKLVLLHPDTDTIQSSASSDEITQNDNLKIDPFSAVHPIKYLRKLKKNIPIVRQKINKTGKKLSARSKQLVAKLIPFKKKISTQSGKEYKSRLNSNDNFMADKHSNHSSAGMESHDISMMNKESKCGWLIFGHGVMDSVADCNTSQINIDIDWTVSHWGIGGLYKLYKSIDGKKLISVEVEIKSENNNDTKVYAGLSTLHDANILTEAKQWQSVTDKWKRFVFHTSEMRSERPDIGSKDFGESDWNKIQIIKILFSKPKSFVQGKDNISIRNPRLIFSQKSQLSDESNLKISQRMSKRNRLAMVHPFHHTRRIRSHIQSSTANIETLIRKNGFLGMGTPLLRQLESYTESLHLHETLNDPRFELHGDYFLDYSKVTGGGIRTSHADRGVYDISLTVDLDKTLGWENSAFGVYVENFSGDNGSEDTGDYQSFSNIDDDNYRGYFEVWVEKQFMDGLIRVKAGKVDANSEYGYTENGSEFLNASMLYSPTNFVFPTIPDSSTSINVFIYPESDLYAGIGIFDGAFHEGFGTGKNGPDTFFKRPADLFFISEFGSTWTNEQNKLPGRFGMGIWHHNGTFDTFNGKTDSGTTGYYVVYDQTLWQDGNENEDTTESLNAFFQYGYADEDVSEVNHHVGSGIVWNKPFNKRDNDLMGVAATYVDFSDEASTIFTENSEISYELFYKFQIGDHFNLKPDIQYIVNPGGDKTISNTTVTTLRFEINF